MRIIEIIQKKQKDLNMTSYQLAKTSGVSEGTLSKINSGKIKHITVDTYIKLCRGVGLEPCVKDGKRIIRITNIT